MDNKKMLMYLLVGLLAVISIIFLWFIIREKSKSPAPIQKPIIQKESNIQTKAPQAEISTEQKKADPKLVQVTSAEGTVIQVSENSITLNTGAKEETFDLLGEKQGMSVFKKVSEGIASITLAELKQGDKVKLEIRQADSKVNVIMVK